MKITSIKEVKNIETNELIGYDYKGILVPLSPDNRFYKKIQEEISKGTMIKPAYTEKERLEYFRNKLKNRIKIEFNKRYNNSIILSGSINKEIDAGNKALNDINGLLDLLEPGETEEFRLADNSFITLTRGQLETLKKEILNAGRELYKTKWSLEAKIDELALEDLEVSNVDFDNVQIIINKEDRNDKI